MKGRVTELKLISFKRFQAHLAFGNGIVGFINSVGVSVVVIIDKSGVDADLHSSGAAGARVKWCE